MDDQTAVLASLDEYADAYCAKDVDRLMALFDAGDDISVIGTGADELCAGRAAIESLFRRNFAEATATRFEWGWRHATVLNDSAVVAVSLTIHLATDDGPAEMLLRWTVAMTKREGGWRWVHRHASVAAATQQEGGAYPTPADR